ncbi:MAG: DNA polymerase III subunit beta, partial [Chloroflexota bacterium]
AMDDTRPILTGVLATFSDNELTLAAADSFRLAVRSGLLTRKAAGDFSVIVPGRTLSELSRILQTSGEGEGAGEVSITVTPNRNQIVFAAPDLQVVSRLIEGNFPNYKQIIPSKFATSIVVATGDLLKAAKIASYFSRDNSNVITLDVQPGAEAGVGNVVVSGVAAELGEDRGEIDAVINGAGTKISFNSRYVADVLGVVESTQVKLEISGPNSAAVFRPNDTVEYTHVVMPIHTPSGR